MVLMRGMRIRTLYKLLGRINSNRSHHTFIPETDEILSCVLDSTMLWHKRLRHFDEKGLCAMDNKCMVEGFPNCSTEFDFCKHCFYGKQNHVSFPTRAKREKRILELVHSDMSRPMSVPRIQTLCVFYR